MSGLYRVSLLIYTAAAATIFPVLLTFNIDTTKTSVYSGEKEDFFGYKVLQFNSTKNKGIIITAPLRLNGSGGITKVDQTDDKKWFTPVDNPLTNSSVQQLGFSVAADPTDSSFIACSPSLAHECQGNMYLNSLCYNVTAELQQISSFKPAFQECTNKQVDLVFLFDGSLSMTNAEFEKNKDFIVNIMKSLRNTSMKFAAVQFSSETRTVFDFNDFKEGTAEDKLKKEIHMRRLTNTYRALKFVLKNLLENPAAGSSPDSTKVLMIITDGDPSEEEDKPLIEEYNAKNIIRFVIVVEKPNQRNQFGGIPSVKNGIFQLKSYDNLPGILETFQNKIFKIEGNAVARAGELTTEMSQSGFSAVFHKHNLILGSVGSNSWRGSIQEHHEHNEKQIFDPEMEADSYMGYTVAVGEKDGVPLYFAGAPRFNHTGQVVFFNQTWKPVQRLTGTEIGSYFGAELCSVDIDSDGNFDFLFVGAPMFYQPHEKKEGKIYIYTLNDEMKLQLEFDVVAPSMGRFGTTISSLADLNGDGLRDVAIGAPLEDGNSGVVYIYHGDKNKGIQNTISQKISGAKILPGMKFFGQAIDGRIDLSDDGLPDIVVGSQGSVVVLKSKAVFDVKAHLSFHPKEISIEQIDCLVDTVENLPVVDLTACFEMEEKTKRKAGVVSSELDILYTLSIDPMRMIHRGFFGQNDEKHKMFTSSFKLTDKETCFNHSIFMQKCVRDTLSPINIKLNFSQDEKENTTTSLDVNSRRQTAIEVPFEKQCMKTDICVAELDVDFNFTSATILVTEASYFNITMRLTNLGDNSYNTSLTMLYPEGISYSKMIQKNGTRQTLHNCKDLEGVFDKTVCGISLPVYRSKSFAIFDSMFYVMKDFEFNDTMSMTIVAQSDNSNISSRNSLTRTIPVQYEIKIAITTKEDTVTYLNFSNEDTDPKKIVVKYQLNNLGFKDFPASISLLFPTKLEHNFELKNYEVFVQPNRTQCLQASEGTSEYCSPEKECKTLKCEIVNLESYSDIQFWLEGYVHFKDLKQYAKNIAFFKRYTGDGKEIKFRSFIQVDFNSSRFVLASHKEEETKLLKDNNPTIKWREVRVELLILPDQLLIILTGAGLGLLLLIVITVIMFKLGCFKRKTPEDFQQQEDKNSAEQFEPAEKEKFFGVAEVESGTEDLKETTC